MLADGVYFNSLHEAILGNIPDGTTDLYWILPNKFLGNQVIYVEICIRILVFRLCLSCPQVKYKIVIHCLMMGDELLPKRKPIKIKGLS